jgi:allantoicase
MGHTRHVFGDELAVRGPFTHVRLKVFPDGGVSRLRALGQLTLAGRDDAAARLLSTSSPRDVEARLRACCAPSHFIETMTRERPFDEGGGALMARAHAVVSSLGETRLLEAMAAHPRIGASPKNNPMSAAEQACVSSGSPDVLAALVEVNRAYEAKHGFVFLICATSKTAGEVLESARTRLEHTRAEELEVAARELADITVLRLRKLVGD